MAYQFKSVKQFLEDMESNKIPMYVRKAFNTDVLQIRGNEMDWRFCFLYPGRYKGFKTKFIKELLPGDYIMESPMGRVYIYREEKKEPVIEEKKPISKYATKLRNRRKSVYDAI